jgi:parallel beta-helix repeat protein
VNGFSGYGIAVRRATGLCVGQDVPFFFVRVEGNYLGTDPRGRSAKPNRRGLGVFSDEATVHDNLISGNHRSGIYVESRGFITVQGNRIGVGADGSPLGNGAGILFDLRSPSPGADVMDNVIAYNDGMAIARTRIGEIQVSRNSIFDNLQQGIDVDIDGPTAHRANDTDVPNAPVLFSAAYDAGRNATIVRGHIDSDAAASFRFVDVYASSRLSVWSTPQAEQMVATQVHLPSGHQDFEVVVPGDHRGKWITATFNAARATGFVRAPRGGISTQNHLLGLPTNTSELSNAVMAR